MWTVRDQFSTFADVFTTEAPIWRLQFNNSVKHSDKIASLEMQLQPWSPRIVGSIKFNLKVDLI